jgi:hypothetical protein
MAAACASIITKAAAMRTAAMSDKQQAVQMCLLFFC